MSLQSFIFGSSIYELTNENSDVDIAYIVNEDSVESLKQNHKDDIYIWSLESFEEDLNKNQNLIAIEIYFANQTTFNTQGITYNLDKQQLRSVVSRTVDIAFVKAKKKFKDGELYIGLKSYWHCIRILNQMIDLVSSGTYTPKITDENLRKIYLDIMSYNTPSTNLETLFDILNSKYKEDLKIKKKEFQKLCPKESNS